ncbi:MAG: prepilin peptidase [Pirellulales bacterium]|nr:prepilin peptidase [Pirellulales bacterium]
MNAATVVFLAAVGVLTLVAAFWDARTRKLPNWLTVSGFAAALLFHVTTGGLAGLGYSLVGFLTGFGILLLLWLTGGGGAGDVKLMGALGAWLGAKGTLYVFFVSAILVVIGFVGWFAYRLLRHLLGFDGKGGRRKNLFETLRPKRTLADGKPAPRRGIVPFALPLALSTWLVLLAWRILAIPVLGAAPWLVT